MNLRRLNSILLQTLLVPIVALLIVAALLALQIRRASGIVARMEAANDNITTATLAAELTTNEENGLRGYQLTRDPVFLQTYTIAQAPLQATLSRLRDGIARAGGDPNVVDQLVLAHDTWRIAFAEPIIQATHNGTDTRDSNLNLRTKNQMDHVTAMISNIVRSQTSTRNSVLFAWREQVRLATQALIALAIIVGLAVGIFARNRLRRVSVAFQQTVEEVQSSASLTYASEQRLRTVLTSIGDGIIVCDRKGRVELLNTLAEELTGWSLAEAAGEDLNRVLHTVNETTRMVIEPTGASSFPQLPPQATPAINDPLANHPLLIRRDGSEIPVEKTEAPIRDREDKVAGVVIAFRDITEQRRAQTTLLATEKHAVTGRLAATLAHEIHNPLDAAMNLLYLMSSNPTPDDNKMFLDMASKELNRISQITRAMLGMYRESKEPVALDVQEMLDNILLLLDPQMRQARVKLRAEFAPRAVITGFPAELRQVFTNLLTNAAEASPPDTFIQLRTEVIAEQRSSRRPAGVEIRITDRGNGIDPKIVPKLFQPFFTTKGEKGTGLGLWVSKGIVEKHNGSIEIKSSFATANGTTVTVFLPRGDATLYQSA
jgi:signal transduction histidine kinase/CHASE3 domain sensor protein